MKILLLVFPVLLINSFCAHAQEPVKEKLIWWNPANNAFPPLEGQEWPHDVGHFYDRLPAKAEKAVRKEVWDLSRNAAGLQLRFRTDAEHIAIRYVVENERYNMPHFPSTGVSGVDLYSPNLDGSWAWAEGAYKFGDTITYTYEHLELDKNNYPDGREYHLYLPLYNTVRWLEIGVPAKDHFSPLPPRKEKPIVVYGTSIAQGGCASRAGMAWTALLERSLGIPMVNMGFSGNGRLEKEVVDVLLDIDARVFVIDCLPNLTGLNSTADGGAEIKRRYKESVETIRKKYPKTPILLTEHASFIKNRLNAATRTSVTAINSVLDDVYAGMLASGITGLYLLKAEAIGMDTDDMVDGLHPTDAGMKKYASAYEKILKEILKK